MMVEVLEKAFAEYEQGKQAKSDKTLRKPKKNQPKKLFSHPNKTFNCDDCKEEFQDETAYSYMANLTKLTKTYCGKCVNNKEKYIFEVKSTKKFNQKLLKNKKFLYENRSN